MRTTISSLGLAVGNARSQGLFLEQFGDRCVGRP